MQNSYIKAFYRFSQNNKYEIPPLILFCLDLLILLTIPIITHKTMIITINMNTVTVEIVITPTLKLQLENLKV